MSRQRGAGRAVPVTTHGDRTARNRYEVIGCYICRSIKYMSVTWSSVIVNRYNCYSIFTRYTFKARFSKTDNIFKKVACPLYKVYYQGSM